MRTGVASVQKSMRATDAVDAMGKLREAKNNYRCDFEQFLTHEQ